MVLLLLFNFSGSYRANYKLNHQTIDWSASHDPDKHDDIDISFCLVVGSDFDADNHGDANIRFRLAGRSDLDGGNHEDVDISFSLVVRPDFGNNDGYSLES